MIDNQICMRLTGCKSEIDKAIVELNRFLMILSRKKETQFSTSLDYPESFLVRFSDSTDATAASMKISSMMSDYDEYAKRTKTGVEKHWTDPTGKEVLRVTIMPEDIGEETGWNV